MHSLPSDCSLSFTHKTHTVHYTFLLNMFSFIVDFLTEHLPVFVNIDCSDCKTVDALILSPLHGVALIKTHAGQVYSTPCKRFDMLRIKKYDSVGDFINECCFA